MKKTDQTGSSALKKATTAFWGMTVLSVLVYIAYSAVGVISYKKLGRYPGFEEYLANIFNYNEPLKTMTSAYDYITNPTLLISILFGIRLMLVGYRYKLESNDSKLLTVYSLFAVTSVVEAMKRINYLNDRIPGMLKLASPFILVGSAVLDIVFSLKIRKTPCGRWLFASLLTEIFRIVGLSLIIDFTSVGIKNLIFYACISFGLNLIFGMDINFASAESGSSSTANAREKADLLKSIRAAENAVAGKKAALNKHNRGDLGYGYVDNKTMMNSIRGIEKNLEIDKKKLEKLS